MPKFTFICDHSCDLDTHVVKHEFNAETYWEAIEQFEFFLRGSGYHFDGNIDIVEPVTLNVGHSNHYFDTERNR